jgi:hypothetical protein
MLKMMNIPETKECSVYVNIKRLQKQVVDDDQRSG